MTHIDYRTALRGWKRQSTGGGCTALYNEIDAASETYQLLTVEDDAGVPHAPTSMHDGPVMLSHHAEGQMTHWREFLTLAACVAWLETAEYVLPENGDGATANGWRCPAVIRECPNSCCFAGVLTTGAPCPTCRGSGVEG